MARRRTRRGFIAKDRHGRPMVSAKDIKDRHEARLMKTPGVVGVGIGRKDGKECIRVYVENGSPKVLSALPRSLEDVPVEVVVSGSFRAR